jgi:uncharacterized protein YeaO (DUF488 family)
VVRGRCPSDALRKWCGHAPGKFDEFAARYRRDLYEPERGAALAHLLALSADSRLTLLTATKQIDISQAAIVAEVLRA